MTATLMGLHIRGPDFRHFLAFICLGRDSGAQRTRAEADSHSVRGLKYHDYAISKKLREYQCLTEPQPAAKAAGAILELILVEATP